MFSKDSLQMVFFVGGLFAVILGLHFYLNDGFGPAFSPKFFENNKDVKEGFNSLGSVITEGGKTFSDGLENTKKQLEEGIANQFKKYENDRFILTYPALWGMTEYERVVAFGDGKNEISVTYFDDANFFNETENKIKKEIISTFSSSIEATQKIPESIIMIDDLVGLIEKKKGSVSFLFPIDGVVIVATTRGEDVSDMTLQTISGIDFKGDKKESESCSLSSKSIWKSSDESISVEHIPLLIDLLVVKKPNNAVFVTKIYNKEASRVWSDEKNFVGEIYLPYNTDTNVQTVKFSIFDGGINSRIVHECIRLSIQ